MNAAGAAQGWDDNLVSWAMYWGFILGSRVHAGKLITQSCYYGLFAQGGHELEVNYYDTQGCAYAIAEPFAGFYGNCHIHYLDGEDYASPKNNNTQTTDVYINPNIEYGNAYISIYNFHMESQYQFGGPNPRFPVVSNSSPVWYPVTIKNIQAMNSVSGPTAGQVFITALEYTNSGNIALAYKKMMFVFQGYENDTTSNQTVNYPRNGQPHNNTLTFTATPAITANTTGLIITASTSGLTIIAPSSKTTYSGVVIVEGY